MIVRGEVTRMLPGLDRKDCDIKDMAAQALADDAVLDALLEGILQKTETVRFNSFNVLLRLSEERPERLYPKWDRFEELLGSKNTYHKYIAIYLIANLTKVDTEGRFERIFDRFYGLLDDKSIIPASHVAGNSGKIVKAKPELRSRITEKLLDIDSTHHQPERRDLIKSYIIQAFDEFLEESEEREEIVEFVRQQLDARSPKTRKVAKEFLAKWET